MASKLFYCCKIIVSYFLRFTISTSPIIINMTFHLLCILIVQQKQAKIGKREFIP